MTDVILTLNAGASSIKFSLFSVDTALEPLYHGRISNILESPHFVVYDSHNILIVNRSLPVSNHYTAIHMVLEWLYTLEENFTLCAIGHRVVHGGQHYTRPTVIIPHVIAALKTLIPLAPLHQPPALDVIESLHHTHPSLLQVACFDTAFHTTQSALTRKYALPRALTEKGIIRYGFHGLSYEYINRILPDHAGGNASKRVIIAHLGNGASMCALLAGQSIASSMGFTALDGLIMGTRTGSIDPGVLLYLMEIEKMTAKEVEHLLYHQSGLLGISGISYDMQTLIENTTAEAQEAIAMFCYRATQEIGALAAALGGLDVLVFTAGIGENSPLIRQKISESIHWLGVILDNTANKGNAPCINTAESQVSVFVLPTNEELMIAQHTAALL